MNLYKEQFLVIFGGASTYLKSIKMRLCLNDLHIFDVQDNRWTKIDDQPLTPKSRMGHVSQIFGSMMLV
jgi:N-acetylneuraminic acid mutarotase